MNKHQAIIYTLREFCEASEYGAIQLLYFVKTIARSSETEKWSRVDIHKALGVMQGVRTVNTCCLEVLELQDTAEEMDIRTVKLDGTEVL